MAEAQLSLWNLNFRADRQLQIGLEHTLNLHGLVKNPVIAKTGLSGLHGALQSSHR